MNRLNHIACFLIINLLVSAAIYRDALWGGSLLAPLDLGPDFFYQYRFMDPSADGIPDNHHIIDQFTYDLPLQHAIYRSYRQGEIPWWDPYTFGGRPLLADAHINGTDPIRLLCYAALPFELAYNWNFVLRGLVTGLGMLLLLRELGVRPLVAAILALTYQYAGWFTVFFGHPWIQGSFQYFPFLWLAWLRSTRRAFGSNVAIGGVLCGLIFYSGNLQSHAYLPIFALAFLVALLIKDRGAWPKAFGACALSGVIGALLAFPVLVNQVEFFLLSLRPTAVDDPWYAHLMTAPVSLFAFYPWSFGSFRTLDAARLVGAGGIGYHLFFGAVGTFFAFLGAWHLRKDKGIAGWVACQSLLMIGIYLLIIATPAAVLLYSRCAALAGMGLILLAGLAIEGILAGRIHPAPAWTRGFVGITLSIAVASSGLAWFVYPRFKQQIAAKLAEEKGTQSSSNSVPAIRNLRALQVERFPDEVSLRNPEAAITLLAVLLAGFALARREGSGRQALVLAALCASALPVLIFHVRFRPKHPVEQWHRMLAGGPAQQEAIRRAAGGLRLDESGQVWADMIFPNALATLYGVHAVFGYSALQPPGLFRYPSDGGPLPVGWKADLIPAGKDAAERIAEAPGDRPSRFRLANGGTAAPVRIVDESFCRLDLDVSRMDSGEDLIRTDTWYPGWRGGPGIGLAKSASCFTRIGPVQKGSDATLRLRYVPTGLNGAIPAIATGLVAAAGLSLNSLARSRKTTGNSRR